MFGPCDKLCGRRRRSLHARPRSRSGGGRSREAVDWPVRTPLPLILRCSLHANVEDLCYFIEFPVLSQGNVYFFVKHYPFFFTPHTLLCQNEKTYYARQQVCFS